MRRSLILCTAVGFVAAVSFAASPAQASFRVIKWNVTQHLPELYDCRRRGTAGSFHRPRAALRCRATVPPCARKTVCGIRGGA